MAAPSSYFISRQKLTQEAIWNMVAHPTANKIYIGGVYSTDPERKNLNVIDLARYPDYDNFQKGYADVLATLKVGHTSSVVRMALNPNAQKLYLLVLEVVSHNPGAVPAQPASFYSFLSVYDLDINGNISGNGTSYQLDKADVSDVDSFVIHPSLPLMYVTEGQNVFIYDLDANGLPMFINPPLAGSTIPVADHKNQSFNVAHDRMYCLAIHEDGKRLYAGHSNSGLVVATLDATGKNVIATQPFTDNPFPGNFTWGDSPGDVLSAQVKDPFYFHYTSKGIYRRIRPHDGWIARRHGNFPLHIWPLDANGDINTSITPNPAGIGNPPAKSFPNILWDNESFLPTTTAIYCTQPVYFDDAVTGEKRIGSFVLQQFPLDGNGFPQTDAQGNPVGGQQIVEFDDEEPYMLRVTNAQTPLVLTRTFLHDTQAAPNIVPQVPGTVQVKGQFLKCTIVNSDPIIDNTWKINATLDMFVQPIPYVINNLVAIIPLDDLFLQLKGIQLAKSPLRVSLYPSFPGKEITVNQISWKLEYYDGDPAQGGTSQKTLTDTTYGRAVNCHTDSYSYQTNSPQGRYDRFNLLSAQWQTWAAEAASVAIDPSIQVKKFILSAYAFTPEQAHPTQIESMVQFIESFGINTMIIEDVSDAARRHMYDTFPQGVDIIKKSIKNFMGAISTPLTDVALANQQGLLAQMDFFLESQDLNGWANDIIDGIIYKSFGGSEMINFAMFDEFGFYYLKIIDSLNANPIYLNIFLDRWHAFLISKKLQPVDFGLPDWGSVKPVAAIPDSVALNDINNRKLYFWAIYFLQLSAVRGFNLTALSLRKVFPDLKYWYVNLDTTYGKRNNLSDKKNPSSFEVMLNWFDAGRYGSQLLWSEDYFDNNAWEWSFNIDMLSSAANASHANPNKYLPIGSYVRVGVNGITHPAGVLYKTLILASRNAKVIDFYTLGGYQEQTPWVINHAVYKPVSDGIKLLGIAEDFLYDGNPARGKIALFSTGASMLWDQIDVDDSTYSCDLKGIYAALLHEGYSVDFVDDTDIEAGFLTERDYKILYVTAPNLTVKCYEQIDSWVGAGGNLVVTQGAAIYDEYNSPTNVLDNVLGVKNRLSNRVAINSQGIPYEAIFNLNSNNLPPLWLQYKAIGLTNAGATALYSLTSGELMMTQNKYVKGNAFCLAFLPGVEYLNARYAIRNPDVFATIHNIALMDKWRDDYRQLAMLPITTLASQVVNMADWKLVDINQKMVEAVVMQSSLGIAIVLFNWSNDIVTDLLITLQVSDSYSIVNSAQGSAIKNLVISETRVQFTLGSLQYVDVIMIWYGKIPVPGPGPNPNDPCADLRKQVEDFNINEFPAVPKSIRQNALKYFQKLKAQLIECERANKSKI